MTTLPDFRLETHFSKWEFKARYHMTASDAESMSLPDLLDMASPEDRAGFENMWLGYTETYGAPDLRAAIAGTFAKQTAQDVLCFAGASEGIFAADTVLLDKDSHAIVVTPNYQRTRFSTVSVPAMQNIFPISRMSMSVVCRLVSCRNPMVCRACASVGLPVRTAKCSRRWSV